MNQTTSNNRHNSVCDVAWSTFAEREKDLAEREQQLNHDRQALDRHRHRHRTSTYYDDYNLSSTKNQNHKKRKTPTTTTHEPQQQQHEAGSTLGHRGEEDTGDCVGTSGEQVVVEQKETYEEQLARKVAARVDALTGEPYGEGDDRGAVEEDVRGDATTTNTPAVTIVPAAATMRKTVAAIQQEGWEIMFEKLKQYKEVHGTCNVVCDSGKLGGWVTHQRSRYRANKMVPAQLEALTVLGFKWRLQHHAKPRNKRNTSFNDEHFVKMVDRFVLYTEETGNRWIPTKYEDKLLVHWGVNMRRDKRTGKLCEDRITALEKVGFVWVKKKIDQK